MLWLWLILAMLLVLVELHQLAFFAMFVALGAAGAALVALAAPSAVGVQGAVFVAVAVAGVAAVRPFVSKAYERSHPGGQGIKGIHGGLIGQRAITLDLVGDAHHVGHVQLGGERWLAVRSEGEMIPANTAVLVKSVHGTTLAVVPVDEP